jgi:hypothetical protein
MSEVKIDPLDYPTTFTFPAKGSTTEHYDVTVLNRNRLWMLCRIDPAVHVHDVYTLDGTWMPILALNPHSADEVARISFGRDRAIAIAHFFADFPGAALAASPDSLEEGPTSC